MFRRLVILNLLTAPPFPAYDHVRSRLRLRYLIDARNGGAVRLRVHWGTDKLTCGYGLVPHAKLKFIDKRQLSRHYAAAAEQSLSTSLTWPASCMSDG